MFQQRQKYFLYGFLAAQVIVTLSLLISRQTVITIAAGTTTATLLLIILYISGKKQPATATPISPAVVFLTGLSGAGKTTIAKVVIQKLQTAGIDPVLLDGDEIRNRLHLTGFDEASRKKHNLNVGFMAGLLEAKGNLVIVSLISPYEDIRQQIRGMCHRFIEVYVCTELAVCIQRDSKGLYKKALSGEIPEFTGVSAPYYPPVAPELVLDTAVLNAEECAIRIIQSLQST